MYVMLQVIAEGTYEEMRDMFRSLPITNKVLGQLKGCTRDLVVYEVKEVIK